MTKPRDAYILDWATSYWNSEIAYACVNQEQHYGLHLKRNCRRWFNFMQQCRGCSRVAGICRLSLHGGREKPASSEQRFNHEGILADPLPPMGRSWRKTMASVILCSWSTEKHETPGEPSPQIWWRSVVARTVETADLNSHLGRTSMIVCCCTPVLGGGIRSSDEGVIYRRNPVGHCFRIGNHPPLTLLSATLVVESDWCSEKSWITIRRWRESSVTEKRSSSEPNLISSRWDWVIGPAPLMGPSLTSN